MPIFFYKKHLTIDFLYGKMQCTVINNYTNAKKGVFIK